MTILNLIIDVSIPLIISCIIFYFAKKKDAKKRRDKLSEFCYKLSEDGKSWILN